jgi:hypothetical protein
MGLKSALDATGFCSLNFWPQKTNDRFVYFRLTSVRPTTPTAAARVETKLRDHPFRPAALMSP